MSLHIFVITGKKAGVHFEIKPNLKFGRIDADFILDDKSASSQHAQIKEIGPGQFLLVDLKSKNGIKINGLREDEIPLANGVKFVIGQTLFEVRDLTATPKPTPPAPQNVPRTPLASSSPPATANLKAPASPSISPKPSPAPAKSAFTSPKKNDPATSLESLPKRFSRNIGSMAPPPPQVPEPESTHSPFTKKTFEREADDLELDSDHPGAEESSSSEPSGIGPKTEVNPTTSEPSFVDFESSKLINVVVNESWNETLENLANKTLPLITNIESHLAPFNPALKLVFTRGLQVDTEWVLGYGPRKVGAHEYDLTIFEPQAPGLCFELLPTENGIIFKTEHKNIVLYNQSSVEQTILKTGDNITIGNTKIRVELIP